MYVYYFLAAVACFFGFQSLRSGFRYVAYVKRETSKPLPNYQPFVSVIAPSRGLEPGLEENLRTLLNQDYPFYEVLFVFDRKDDPAVDVLSRLAPGNVSARTIISGPASDSGQKVHNLRVAVDEVDSKSEVLVFVDTDARPGKLWLRKLVAPLADETLAASSGYRWFVPKQGGLASRMRSVWNASVASALGEDRQKNFCWGGSTAIRRSVFAELNIRERWRGSVSDDFTVTNVIKEAKLPIHFTPHCLVASVGDCDLGELFEFTTRQIKITRVYAPQLWKPLLLGCSLFTIVFFGGILLLFARIALGHSWLVLFLVLCLVFALGAIKAVIRLQVVGIPLVDYKRELRRDMLAHFFLWPVASFLYLYNAIVAGFSRRVSWRGITYELKSPNEAVIISRDHL
jgi:cellulose synthase/poly-beta-1,6-N-acetylglucosamine synthase-like glycosyltransferase